MQHKHDGKTQRERALREQHNDSVALLKLPPELRFDIYELLIPAEPVRIDLIQPGDRHKSEYDRYVTLCPLLHICRRIRSEFLPVYIDRNILVFRLYGFIKGYELSQQLPRIIMSKLRQFDIRIGFRCKGTKEARHPWTLFEGGVVAAANRESETVTGTSQWSDHWPQWKVPRDCCIDARSRAEGALIQEITSVGLQIKEKQLRRSDFEVLSSRVKSQAFRNMAKGILG